MTGLPPNNNNLRGALLNMLHLVCDICNRHEIQYFLLEGSLLGAIRHQGMIPWDDDIDIGMPRDDYNRFLSIAKKQLGSHYTIVTYQSGRPPLRSFAQIEDKDIQLATFAHINPLIRNAWIDIFPIDGMPSNFILRRVHHFQVLFKKMKIQFAQIDDIVDIKKKNRPLYEQILIWLSQKTHVGINWEPKTMIDELDRLLQKYPYRKCEYVINASSAYKFRSIYPKSWLGSGDYHLFESEMRNIPQEPLLILEYIYGSNYMTPIVEEKRNHHNTQLLDKQYLHKGSGSQ